MKTLNDIISMLKDIRLNSADRGNKVMHFNKMIFHGQHENLPEEIRSILVNLASIIEYYEENPEFREQAPSFFGCDRLEIEIDDSFEKLRTLGISI